MNLQLPSGLPSLDNNDKIDWNSWFDWIVYIILPLLLIVAYIVLRKRSKKQD